MSYRRDATLIFEPLVSSARSRHMAQVKQKDTKPELLVRRTAHALGYRFRLHRKELPGRPDIVFASRKKVIFVHGCFWHRHDGCSKTTTPKTRHEFWQRKFRENIARDQVNLKSLKSLGWEVLIVWECEVANLSLLKHKLIAFLDS